MLSVHLLPDLVSPAALAGRTAVVIDVLRATTTICHALAAGATAVVPCLEIDEARAKAFEVGRASVVLGGERRGLKIEGFDLGNAPTEYVPQSVGGKTVVFTTTNGTRAMRHAGQAAEILIGAFVNLSAVVAELRSRDAIDLVCAGTGGAITAEDALFAGAIVERLTEAAIGGTSSPRELNDQARLVRDAWRKAEGSGTPLYDVLRECQGGLNLIAEGFDADIDTAAKIDAFDFVPRLDLATGRITLMRPDLSRLLYILGAIVAAVLIFIYATFNPEMYSFFPKCIFHTLFGIDCPGCGSQRAIHALLHGNIYQAIDYNLLLVLSLPLFLTHLGCKLVTLLTGKQYSMQFLYYPITPKLIAALVIAFWIVRNIPVYPFNFLTA